jgi:hypothetical protein
MGANAWEATLSLDIVRAIWQAPPLLVDDQRQAIRELTAARRKHDHIFLCNGDQWEGILTGLVDHRLTIAVSGKPVGIEWAKVAAVGLSTELQRALRVSVPYGRIVLADGGRLTVVSARTAGNSLHAKTAFGLELRFPMDQVVGLDWYSEQSVPISDLEVSEFQSVNFLGGPGWPLVRDGSVGDGDLAVGGGSYDKGLGVHSASRLSYELQGAFRRFEALVGLDDHNGRSGQVRIRILLDGKPRALDWDGKLTHFQGPRRVSLKIQGAKILTLIVDFGPNADVQGRVDWVDARLIR